MKTRSCGILMPIFSLPSIGGIGDFGPEAYNFANKLTSHGISTWQILPLNPGNPENGESPYFSISAFAINPLYISLELLIQQGLLTNKELSACSIFSDKSISYSAVRCVKMPLLEKAAQRFTIDNEFISFCKKNDFWLSDFALFSVLHQELKTTWTTWAHILRNHVSAKNIAPTDSQQKAIHIQKVIQFFAFSQWNRLHSHCSKVKVTIFGDMPIYVALNSSDAWANPTLLKLDKECQPQAVSGVPPDYFSETGQLWNNPVYNWEEHNKTDFAWWVKRMTHLFSLYDIVRIDHFRGLVQYWEIPFGETTAINGLWQDVPTYALFDTLTNAIHPFPVIAEDLGVITDDVVKAMNHYSFFGMKILQFAFGNDDSKNPYLPSNYPDNCVVYTGTHDNMPTLGWLKNASEAERKQVQKLTKNASNDHDIVWSLIELAFSSKATMAIIPFQDVLDLNESSRINNPAMLQGNWRWRWDPKAHPENAGLDRITALGKKHARI